MEVEKHLAELLTSRYPDYRIVWSETRTEWLCGKLIRKYGTGRDRFILEKHCSAESYGSQEEWESAIDENGVLILGPFPRSGDWEHCYTFEAGGQFVRPTEELVRLLCVAINRGLMHTRSERWAAIKEAKDKRERDRKQEFDDIWDDSRPAPGAKLPDHIERMDSFDVTRKTTADIPLALPQQGFGQVGAK